jgi:hypothetical protein
MFLAQKDIVIEVLLFNGLPFAIILLLLPLKTAALPNLPAANVILLAVPG